jgi:adenylate cyclase 10
VRVIASQGGDVFKFAGDALLVLWPPSDEDVSTKARRAAQSALEIQRKMNDAKLQEDVTLSVKLGIGVGTCSIVHVGGVLSRMEYLATGAPLIQAFQSEHLSQPGKVFQH